MLCAHCGNPIPASETVLACPVCGKLPSRFRLFYSAEVGDADAMALSALFYRDEPGDEAKRFRQDFLFRAAAGGSYFAALAYARSLLSGEFGLPDSAGAKAVLLPYARRNLTVAALLVKAGLLTRPVMPSAPEMPKRASERLRMAALAEEELDYACAQSLVRLSAEEGDPAAEELLGRYYEEGKVLTFDPAAARRWYVSACEHGSNSAYVRLGDALLRGTLSESPEPETAMECYRCAAENGFLMAQVRLGDGLLAGTGGQTDIGGALAWFRKAAAQGDAHSREQVAHVTSVLDESYRRATAFQAAGEPSRAIALYQELAGMGYAEAANRLGYLAQHGIGGKRDRRAAARWYEAGASGGSVAALYNLAVCYAEGIGVAFDGKRAEALFEHALSRGCRQAEEPLARLKRRRRKAELRKVYALGCTVYHRGEFAKAAKYFLRAAEMGDPTAAYRLACHLRYGDGVAQDEGCAAAWEARAKNTGFTDAKRISLGYLRARREQELLGRIAE